MMAGGDGGEFETTGSLSQGSRLTEKAAAGKRRRQDGGTEDEGGQNKEALNTMGVQRL